MFTRMPIRKKIVCATLLLACTLLLLIGSSLRGFYAYRELATMISTLASDLLPLNYKIARDIDDLRVRYQPERILGLEQHFQTDRTKLLRSNFPAELLNIRENVKRYQSVLQKQAESDVLALGKESAELKLTRESLIKLNQVITASSAENLLVTPGIAGIENDLYELSELVHQLPPLLQKRMATLRDRVRVRYRTWYAFIVTSSLASFMIIGLAYAFFRRSVVQPFKELLAGSRLIAKGNFEHRIVCDSGDELSELAEALNAMTERFVQIRDHLNEKVQDRTREVVRSEQLASVGFLAAGVAHEINNPLASIAWSAEALEGRLHEILHGHIAPDAQGDHAADHAPGVTLSNSMDPDELNVLRKYLKRIQDEAFRCKGITERLLDFSRLGESQRRQACDVNELVGDVIALVEHLAPYRTKKIEFSQLPGLSAWVSPTEFKQVVLNLLTNALDSTDQNGVVRMRLEHDQSSMRLMVEDNGCGMTEEVLRHLYEPFFTRRRDGKGTGLGLSITYRIVQDHGGQIVATSEGPGLGSRFQISLPLEPDSTSSHDSQKYAA
ncbi:MAG: HAMP domain-containing histidine kinase [Pirellulaceae bacterium]|nr:HAMP domain-containing histidine kinase [Pirellulaceae bacterium]